MIRKADQGDAPGSTKKGDFPARAEKSAVHTAAREYREAMFKNPHDSVIIHDLNGRVIDVNEKMLRMYGLTREQAIGLNIIEDYSPPDNPRLLKKQPALWKKVLEGESQLFEWKAMRPLDHSVFDVEVSLTKLSLREGDFILATTRDITERKRVERELLATRNYLNTVFNNIHDAIMVHDSNGKVVDVNDKFLDMYRFTREEAIGLSIIPDYAILDEKVDQRACWRKALAGEDQAFECRGRRPKDGYEFDAEIYITKLSLPEGDFILGNVRDITQRKYFEAEWRAEKQKFETLAESSPVGMVVIGNDDGYRFKYANPTFRRIFGYGANDMLDKAEWFSRAYPDPGTRHRVAEKWTDVLTVIRPGEGRSYVRKACGKNGVQKDIKFVPVKLDTGEILMTCWDITKNLEAEKKRRERNLVLEVLNDIMASVTSSLDLAEILGTLKKVFAEKLKIGGGAVFLYNEPSNKMNLEAWWGVPESVQNEFESLALGCYSAGQIVDLDDGTILRSRLIRLQPEEERIFKRYRWYGYLCMSLVVKGEMQGMIFLVDKRRESFMDDRIAFYKTLGQQIGVAIQNARLFEEVRQSHEQMKALSLRLVEVQEAERRYLARELHDEIGQQLTGLKLALEMNALRVDGSGERSLADARLMVNKLMGLVRELSLNLRPAMLDDLGLVPTLLWHLDRFTNQTSIRVAFKQRSIEGRRFPIEVETAVYRIIQEALTNVARHAKVSDVIVRLWADRKSMGAQIEDGGRGFNVDAVMGRGKSNGLDGMRERAILLGGHFTVESQPGNGTRLTAELPIELGGQLS
jgi:PAS domain S-box-containing protein